MPLWLAIRKVVLWLFLVIAIDVAVGHGLQVAVENAAGRVDTSGLGPTDVPSGLACPVLDQRVQRAMTIDELHDLHDLLCPIVPEPKGAES